jgi:hypothetical protein
VFTSVPPWENLWKCFDETVYKEFCEKITCNDNEFKRFTEIKGKL